MKRASVQFIAPRKVSTRYQRLPAPNSNQLLVKTELSAISSGTELLAYRGQLPADLPLDQNIAGMQRASVYPFSYGYAAVGAVVETGDAVEPSWADARVFAFNPHESHFLCSPETLIRIPEDIRSEDAVFLANMETAVSFLMDGRPMIGERVLVIGLGVVGLLVVALLLRNRDLSVYGLDLKHERRARAQSLGPCRTFDAAGLNEYLATSDDFFDLVFELSGNPAGLNAAIEAARETGRIIVGSWYGTKPAMLELGGRFHRAKLNLYASQVSEIDPSHTGRWTKKRRMEVALSLLKSIHPGRFITHEFHVDRAAEAYALLDSIDAGVLQVVFRYDRHPSNIED